MQQIVISLVFLTLGCSLGADKRAGLDRESGSWQGTLTSFVSDQGHLHILEANDEKLTIRAVNSQFAASLQNLDSQERAIELNLKNISPSLQINVENSISNQIEPGELRLDKKLILRLAPNATARISASLGESSDFAFLAMGDIQNGIEDIDDVIEKLNTFKDEADFLLFLGDATMRSGEDEFDEVKEAYDRIEIPIYSTPGNHDISSVGMYQEYFGRASYSFTHKGVRFTSVDSGDWGLGETGWQWLREWLKLGQDQPHLIFSHIPPKDINGIRGGHWRSRREAHAFIGHAAKYGVDGMFFGHLHTLDQYSLAGIPVVVSGGAGAFEETLDGIKRHFVKVIAKPSKSQFFMSTIHVD